MAFYVSVTDPAVTPGNEVMLQPAPTRVEYPSEMLGEVVETPDGRAVVQQPAADARTRKWVWSGYPGFLVAYERQFQVLTTLRSRYRQEAGQSPYVWVRDNTTKLLRKRVATSHVAHASTSTATTLVIASSPAWATNVLAEGVVEVVSGTGVNQRRRIVSNTVNTLTIDAAWTTIPHGATVRVTYWSDAWFRARVLEVSRKLRNEGGNVRYEDTVFAFAIEDTTYNDLG